MSGMAGTIAPLRVALAQIDSRVGDLEGNAAKIAGYVDRARDAGAELVLFPELALTGYPPEDLLLKEHFLQSTAEALAALAPATDGIVALVGFPERTDDVHNALAVLCGGELRAVYRKSVLPNYGVFDEQRYFQFGDGGAVLELGGARLGLTICEDIWTPGPPASDEALAGASLILNASASPYHAGKGTERERMLAQRARDNLCAVAFCNCVGGQDELVFDGHSVVVDHEGAVIARSPQFEEALTLATVDLQAAITARLRDTRLRPPVRRALPEVRRIGPLARREDADAGPAGGDVAALLDPEAEVYAALVLGVRGYVEKNGFRHVVIGLSGGIDSTLVLLIAVDALGSDRVTCVTMPSRYSSVGTRDDAKVLADNLGVELIEIPIGPAMEVYDALLAEPFEGRAPDITEENLQARIRGNLLMALSNKFGWLVLTTGNKSENSVGYSTLYGDSAGGFAPIKDVLKTLVYRLADYRDARDGDHPVPRSIIDRPPSAELREDQRDADSLPDYDTLDAILEAYIEEDADLEQLERAGLPAEAIERAITLVDRSEYKRRQAPPGIKITPRAFGRDRRMPITNAYRPRRRDVVPALSDESGDGRRSSPA
jgi:NAD+ synthase (glutamine-hydrolysing)